MRDYGTLRIVSENYVDNAAGIAATVNTAPGLGLGNLKNTLRTSIARFNSGQFTLNFALEGLKSVGCVALLGTNLSSDSVMRLQASRYGTVIYDSGNVYAVPGPSLINWDFSQSLNVNNFHEKSATALFWFDFQDCDFISITIADPSRQFIDVARAIIGPYFEPRVGASFGTSFGAVDASKSVTTVSGDIRNDRRPKMRSMELKLDEVSDEDRHRVQALLRDPSRWLLVSAAAGDPDKVREQDLTIYGQATQAGTLAYSSFARHQTTFPFEGWA